MPSCPCQIIDESDTAKDTDSFDDVRLKCSALRDIVIPNAILDKHRHHRTYDRNGAKHCSVPFQAFKRGYLREFTEPIHRFLLDGIPENQEIKKQYRSDLQETWLFQQKPITRFRKARNFFGRWFELRFAQWLKDSGWNIDNIEAFGGPHDIIATSPEGKNAAFEIKYLAQEELSFELTATAIKTGHSFNSMAVYSPLDYLIYRLYEAAQQLQGFGGMRIAVAIIDEYERSFKIPFDESWIYWDNPSFFRKEADIEPFLRKKLAENPNLEDDLKASFTKIDQIWICKQEKPLGVKKMHVIDTGTEEQQGHFL